MWFFLFRADSFGTTLNTQTTSLSAAYLAPVSANLFLIYACSPATRSVASASTASDAGSRAVL